MRRLYITILSILVFLISGSGLIAYAQQLPSQGNWGTYGKHTSASGEVTLTGDVYLKGSIRVQPGTSLVIKSDKNVTIYNSGIVESTGGESRMFTINSPAGGNPCGSLTIEAAPGCTITIDGGANYTWTDYKLEAGTGSRGLSSCISTGGYLTLKNVVIQNVKGLDNYGGAIDISAKAAVPIILENSKILKCYSQLGAAIMYQGSNSLSLTDSEISHCNSGGGSNQNSGGAIRTLGNVEGSLYLTRTKFSYNYAQRNQNYDHTFEKDGNGGALFWNARGTDETKCLINGCLFENNKSDDNGGAIKSQATLIFEGSPTTITGNIAPVGAGLYIEGYTGSAGVDGVRTIDYDLNENLIITGNVSPAYTFGDETFSGKGAGIHYFFGSGMTLEAGSTINVNMNGATIQGNKSQGPGSQGGGIYFENTSEEGKYSFGIYLNNGTIESNISEGDGGGIYVYQGDVLSTYTPGKTLTVEGNSASNGAGIYIKDGNLEMANGTITGNTVSGSGNGGGIYIENGDFTIDAGEVSSNTLDSGQGAGVYIVGSNGKGNFTMNGGEIKDNRTSGNNGGGVYINGGNFTLNDGSITANSSVEGGGVYLNNGNFSLVRGDISGNTVTGNGGGVYLVGEDCEYRLKNGSITGNEAKNGGGVYLANGSFILAEDKNDTGSISSNSASGDGGGVYIAGDGDFTMNGGTVKENETTSGNGGGIFLNGGSFFMVNGYIADNSSKSDGGGICILNGGSFTMNNGDITGNGKKTGTVVTQNGGGVYIDGGTLTVTSGNISSNASNVNGGGVYIMNGTVMMGAGKILSNSCGQYGGGVYVYNSSTTDKKTVTFNGGTLSGNSAKYGGGVCVDGLIDMSIGNVEIAENTATNGGGVCLMNNAFMEFGVGEIKNNTAVKKTSTVYDTGYQKGIAEIEGFGGGVYLDSNTKLVFGEAENLGLFGNLADYGGDEIFANGNGTYVDLPDVSQMALGGYPGASNLKWIEDYPTNDPDYGYGTKLKGDAWDSDKTNLRYRETISQNAQIYNLTGAVTGYSRYICFALGYEVIYITIVRHGLGAGESAIYHLKKNEANDFKIILTGNSTGDPVTKKVAVTAGDWTVTETPWSWAYGTSGRKITRAVPDPDPVTDPVTGKKVDRPFEFHISKTENLPMNSEDIEVNIMGN